MLAQQKSSIVTTVREHLKNLGWEELRPFCWRGRLSQKTLDLKTETDPKQVRANKKLFPHLLREEWRQRAFTAWTSSTNRVAEAVKDLKYDEKWITKIRQRVYFEDGTGQTVMMGAFRSPASLRSANEEQKQCFWPGCSELGTQEHIVWGCHCVPTELNRPPRPSCPAERRLGWGDGSSWTSLEWIKCVAQFMWSCRYAESPWKVSMMAREQRLAMLPDTLSDAEGDDGSTGVSLDLSDRTEDFDVDFD